MSEGVIYEGDCLDVMKKLPDNSINLVVTSPPYGDTRSKQYDDIPIDQYVEWFLPISKEIKRILKPDGSFILNIKERVREGERQTYVLELIIKMREQGWLWTEEYIWHKKTSVPGYWKNRFRDAWERCLHFNKEKNFYMDQKSVMVPIAEATIKRVKNRNQKTENVRRETATHSGFGTNVSNWEGKEKVYPTNVLFMSPETKNTGHSAAFPVRLPTWFIKLFSREGDTVLDPFGGSGSTALACLNENRNYILIEKKPEFIEVIKGRIKNESK